MNGARGEVGGGGGVRAAWERLGAWGMAASVATALAALVVAGTAWPLLRDALARRVGDVAALEAEQEERMGRYAVAMDERVAQINGRSMFFVPPAPAEVAEREEEDPEEEGPAPKPTRYGGPDPIAVINGTVWFGNDRRVAVGEEGGGVRVVSVEGSPWTVRLEWRGVEFDVEVFERTTGRFLANDEGGT